MVSWDDTVYNHFTLRDRIYVNWRRSIENLTKVMTLTYTTKTMNRQIDVAPGLKKNYSLREMDGWVSQPVALEGTIARDNGRLRPKVNIFGEPTLREDKY